MKNREAEIETTEKYKWSWEEKKSKEFKNFLGQQFLLPEEEWDEEFKEYIKDLELETKKFESTEFGPDWEAKSGERAFSRYLKGLDLTEEDLKNKDILDLGCGGNEFIQECLKRGIKANFLGLDARIDDNIKDKEHFVQGSFNKLPFGEEKKFDYIFSVGAVGSCGRGDQLEEELREAIKFLKNNGEIRLYPVLKTPPGTEENLIGVFEDDLKNQETLKKISEDLEVDCKIIPIDAKVVGSRPDVILDQLIVVTKH